MSMSNLSATELASIQHYLALQVMSRGSTILGAQLGGLLNNAIRPKTVREFGGLRRFVQTEISHLVMPKGQDSDSPDLVFAILGPGDKPASIVSPTGIREVAGQELWKIFSNPNVNNELAVNPTGSVLCIPSGEENPNGYTPLVRPSAEAYRHHARQFAELQDGPDVRTTLIGALEGEAFYQNFIAALRTVRTPTDNVLKKWEISRAEFVAQKLAESLAQCSVTTAKVMEIVSLARPVVAPPRPKTDEPTSNLIVNSAKMSQSDEAGSLRSILHHAIDLMSEADLRELKIPVGIFLEAASKAQR